MWQGDRICPRPSATPIREVPYVGRHWRGSRVVASGLDAIALMNVGDG